MFYLKVNYLLSLLPKYFRAQFIQLCIVFNMSYQPVYPELEPIKKGSRAINLKYLFLSIFSMVISRKPPQLFNCEFAYYFVLRHIILLCRVVQHMRGQKKIK